MDEKSLAREMQETINKFANKKMRTAISQVSQGDMAVLMCLYNADRANEDIMPSQISEILKIKRPAVTIALNALEGKGYVVRQRIAPNGDRRKVFVDITPEGIKLIRERMNEAENIATYITENLGEEKARQLIDLVNQTFILVEEYRKRQ